MPYGKQPLDEVAQYYSAKIREFGMAARGVDWNSPESQELRFEQLCRLVRNERSFSICDLGCGYAALFDYLALRYGSFSYVGIDVSDVMIETARSRLLGVPGATFVNGATPPARADYCVASGIFNVRLEASIDQWQTHVEATLQDMDRASKCGFAFNCLTSYSDPDRVRADLYYADPCKLFDFCKRTFSRNVALLHDYGLYEFTILVRKDL